MKTEIAYCLLQNFSDYKKELIKEENDFTITATSASKRIDIPKENFTVIFNKDGARDFKLLSLISNVRNDADKFMESNKYIKEPFVNFFELLEIPDPEEVIYKVDIRSAYWRYSLMKGIISDPTDKLLKELYVTSENDFSKKARLKALGSLATTKRITVFEKGKELDEQPEPIVRPTKSLYMEICRGIDSAMRDCLSTVEGCISYYWDCIFVRKQFVKQAVDFFRALKYDVSIEETYLRYVEIGQSPYLFSVSDNKIYMVRKEDVNTFRYLKLMD